jgi:hypothetical protein
MHNGGFFFLYTTFVLDHKMKFLLWVCFTTLVGLQVHYIGLKSMFTDLSLIHAFYKPHPRIHDLIILWCD